MAGFLDKLKGTKKSAEDPADPSKPVPGFTVGENGQLKAKSDPQPGQQGKGASGDGQTTQTPGSGGNGSGGGNSGGNGDGTGSGSQKGSGTPPPQRSKPDTSALNKQTVQAVSFSNYETSDYAPNMVATPPEIMVGQTTGLAVQDAANYMNAIMQIAVAAQAVAIKKAAEEPPLAELEMPLLKEVQKMVTEAVEVYGKVSTAAGKSSETVISDFNSA